LFFETSSRLRFLFEHDLFWKARTHSGSTRRRLLPDHALSARQAPPTRQGKPRRQNVVADEQVANHAPPTRHAGRSIKANKALRQFGANQRDSGRKTKILVAFRRKGRFAVPWGHAARQCRAAHARTHPGTHFHLHFWPYSPPLGPGGIGKRN